MSTRILEFRIFERLFLFKLVTTIEVYKFHALIDIKKKHCNGVTM